MRDRSPESCLSLIRFDAARDDIARDFPFETLDIQPKVGRIPLERGAHIRRVHPRRAIAIPPLIFVNVELMPFSSLPEDDRRSVGRDRGSEIAREIETELLMPRVGACNGMA